MFDFYRPDYDSQQLLKGQIYLGDFMIKLYKSLDYKWKYFRIPLYPFILNYESGISMIARVVKLLGNVLNLAIKFLIIWIGP